MRQYEWDYCETCHQQADKNQILYLKNLQRKSLTITVVKKWWCMQKRATFLPKIVWEKFWEKCLKTIYKISNWLDDK